MVDRSFWYGIQIRSGIAAPAGAHFIDESGKMTALAVDQHERLVESKTTKAGEVDGIGAVSSALLIIIERGDGHIQLGHEVRLASGFTNMVDIDDIDRHG